MCVACHFLPLFTTWVVKSRREVSLYNISIYIYYFNLFSIFYHFYHLYHFSRIPSLSSIYLLGW